MSKLLNVVNTFLYKGAIRISFSGIVPSLIYTLFYTFILFDMNRSISGSILTFVLLYSNRAVQGGNL